MKINKKIFLCTFTGLTIIFSSMSQAGVVVSGTRFIYSEKMKYGLSVTIKNMSASPYLIQTKIENYNENKLGRIADANDVSFTPVPPLFAMKENGENIVRIIRTGGVLPDDRESVFRMSVAAIPSGSASPDSVQWAIRSNFKLFYRPNGLKGDPMLAYQKLRWRRQGEQITVSNPSSYYITIFNVIINGIKLPSVDMIAPYSVNNYQWCPQIGLCKLEWQSIDDYGAIKPVWYVIPNSISAEGLAEK